MQEGLAEFSQLRAGTYYLVAGTWVVYIESINREEKEAMAKAWSGDTDDIEYYQEEQGESYPMFNCGRWVEDQHPVPIPEEKARALINAWK